MYTSHDCRAKWRNEAVGHNSNVGRYLSVQETKRSLEQRFWPTPQDYNEAVQNLHLNLLDAELQGGQIAVGNLGLPRPITGAFASVYKVDCNGKDWALRCFLRAVRDSEWRYKCISNFIQTDNLRCTVSCDYQPKGIKVSGEWFPILKMEWVHGETLDNYLAARLSQRKELVTITNQFVSLCADLKGAGIAHGDLQHGNIMVHDDVMYLVDYDGMYVPAMHSAASNELGHRNYQHPHRSALHFGPYLDNFSAWVIFTSLYATAIDPSLYERLGAGEDCLLFRQDDFLKPLQSCAFAALEQHSNPDVQSVARILRLQLQQSPETVLGLDKLDEIDSEGLPPIDADTPTSRPHPSPATVVVAPRVDGQAAELIQQKSYAFGPQTEAELNQPIPRKVRFNENCGKLSPWFFQTLLALPVLFVTGLWLLMLFGRYYQGCLLFMLITFVTEGWIWIVPYQQSRLVRIGRVSIGRITRKEFVSTYGGDSDRSRQASYEQLHRGYIILHYQFSINDDSAYSRTMQGQMKVDKEQSGTVKTGQLMTVLYDPELPSNSVIYRFTEYQAC